ncbi:tyrosine-type recombinase/integrase [Methylobacterium mesophilicum]
MPVKPPNPNRYIAEYNGYYRVSMSVPKELREQLGGRLIKGLDTKSLVEARHKAKPIIAEFQKRIDDAWTARGGKKHSLVAEALTLRKIKAEITDPEERVAFGRDVVERIEEIRTNGGRWAQGEFPWEEFIVPTPEAEAEVEQFLDVYHGKTPIRYHHPDFIETLKIKDRSKLDEPRALNIFLEWLSTQREPAIPPFVENITEEIAIRYMDKMPSHTGLAWGSNAKYFGRLKYYWKWMLRRRIVKSNPFADLAIPKEEIIHDEEERAYTDSEIQRLFMGKPPEGRAMLDVMAVGALTGARLDAVIDLRVGECDDGWFTFKPQKKEKSSRDVPIHPDLLPIVRRRIEGKHRDDDLFEEWLAPKPPSVKPRSSYFSKRYTAYTRAIGVRDELDNKRRSLINFHSHRRWFITKLERAGVSGDLIAAIVGHKRSGLTLGRYSEGPDMRAAIEAVAKVRLPPLDGSVIVEDRGLTPRRRRQT